MSNANPAYTRAQTAVATVLLVLVGLGVWSAFASRPVPPLSDGSTILFAIVTVMVLVGALMVLVKRPMGKTLLCLAFTLSLPTIHIAGLGYSVALPPSLYIGLDVIKGSPGLLFSLHLIDPIFWIGGILHTGTGEDQAPAQMGVNVVAIGLLMLFHHAPGMSAGEAVKAIVTAKRTESWAMMRHNSLIQALVGLAIFVITVFAMFLASTALGMGATGVVATGIATLVILGLIFVYMPIVLLLLPLLFGVLGLFME